MSDNLQQLVLKAEKLDCTVLADEPLSAHTTFKIGGCCKAMIFPKTAEACGKLMSLANELGIKFTVMGKGSNLLCDDRGYNGVVFNIGSDMGDITLENNCFIRAEAGASLSKLCSFALENGLTGLEFAYGIPGTVGGAVYMNAGAYGGEIKDVIKHCEIVDSCGNVRTISAEEMKLGYRSSIFQNMKDIVITSAYFELDEGDKAEISEKMHDLLSRRKEKQPLEYPSAGSTFKRPEGQFAGKLIQDCGLKGFSVGGAQVSQKHSGFVINTGNATCEDVKLLIRQIQEKVESQTGYFLECEIKFLEY